MKAGLQELPTDCSRVCRPWPALLEQWMVWPEMFTEPLQLTVVFMSMSPSSSAADRVRILKVEPGSYVSFSALLRHWSCWASPSSSSPRSIRSCSVLSVTVEKSFRS